MTDSLFDTNNQDDNIQVDMNKDYLQELVGEGKKFKTPQDLARGKFEADQYVEVLKKRSDELRADFLRVSEENKAKAKLEELIDQMKNQQRQTSSDTPPANDERQPAIKPEDLESLIDSRMSARETEAKARQNFKIVQDKLKERFGNNYQNALNEQIENLGLTVDDVNTLARKSPAAFFKTMGLDQQQEDSFQAPPRTSRRSDSFVPTGKEKRTWSYYQNLKKQNPNLYYDPKIAVQMHNDAMELGESFQDGDYKSV